MSTFQAPKGTFDLLPPDSAAFLAVREAMAAPLKRAGYGYIETPAFENTALFKRGVGESTDIVTKEMYSFTTQGGDEINPLRVLDDKRDSVQKQLVGVPLMVDSLCEACKAYHEDVKSLLTAAGVAFVDDPKLVRGLDYYTRTTFEFVHDGLGSQSAVGGGGRYDGLSEMIGGPALPSVGWALGVDRTVLALEAEGVELELPSSTSVFAVPLGEEARRVLFSVVTELRKAGVAADF